MSEQRLTSLKELLGRRTPGPWKLAESAPWIAKAPDRSVVFFAGPEPPDPNPLRAEHDAAAITALSNAADELVAVAQAAQALIDSRKASGFAVDAANDLQTALSALNDVLEGEGT